MYALPWSMSVSAFYNVREGLQFNRTIQSPTRTGARRHGERAASIRRARSITRCTSSSTSTGTRRSPSAGGAITFSATGFNLLNASTVLGRETRQDFARANYVTSILAPRIFRVGAKVNF